MEDLLIDRLKSINEATGLSIDPFSKSLRSYETSLHPLLKERLVTLARIQDDVSEITTTTSYHYQRTSEGFHGAGLSNYIFQPLFDQEEPEFNQIIYVKCSSKTVGPEGYGKRTMDQIIKSELRVSETEPQDAPTKFTDLCYRYLSTESARDLLQDDYSQTTLSRTIHSFLESNGYTFPASSFLEVPGRSFASPA
jgi:hypothetical protein